jgi:gliding motility-associated-like protein
VPVSGILNVKTCLMRFRSIAIWIWPLLMCLGYSAKAGHIIGADMTYRCLGGGDYEITMKVYRDCFCVNCADFDEEANFSIYACGFNTPCLALNQNSALASVRVRLSSRTPVPAPEYECQETPPNLCVEEGLYRFRLSDFNLRLQSTPETYYIVYQRCCRNQTITNIIQPGSSGATYYVEINPRAYTACSQSPVFNEFPPTVICANTPLDFDHSASDADGDSLSYRFCAPLLGGGLGGLNGGGAAQFLCNGIIPIPSCPPPFDEVIYTPQFSAQNPMRGNPFVSIDPLTGQISGTPEILGQFVVGVCVDEWRNGQLLGTTRRDFQFNTAGCNPTVIADIEAEMVNGQRYFLKSCGSNTVEFINTSLQPRFIREYTWSFPDGNPQIVKTRNASVTFPGIGRYVGQLILNPGLSCSDSLDIILDVFPEINADFEFDYDTCVAGDVVFTDLSRSGAGNIQSWSWDLDPRTRSVVQNPVHLFEVPGEYPVELIVEDANSCRDTIVRTIRYYPVPETVIVQPDASTVCLPAQTAFFNLSQPIDSTYIVRWDFGDGNTGQGLNITHEYLEPGNYTVSVEIISPIGCRAAAVFPQLINAIPSPLADFDYDPKDLNTFNKSVRFTDLSRDAARWQWLFGDGNGSMLQNPTYTYADTGRYEVTLIVTHPNGCMDTISKLLDVEPRVRYFLPNAFTPDGDGLNDVFKGSGIMAGARDFSLTIWNRWGALLFETDNPDQGWNGTLMNTGQAVQSGVYVCLVRYVDPRGNPIEIKGFATLVR